MIIQATDVLDAINRLLVEKWPDRTVHKRFRPKDFERPCFYLTAVKETPQAANIGLLHVTGYYTAVAYEEVDEYKVMEPDVMLQIQTDMLELFAGGTLAVGDRHISVTASGSGMDDGEAYVDIQVEYYRPREEKEDDTPLMGSVKTRIGLEK